MYTDYNRPLTVLFMKLSGYLLYFYNHIGAMRMGSRYSANSEEAQALAFMEKYGAHLARPARLHHGEPHMPESLGKTCEPSSYR